MQEEAKKKILIVDDEPAFYDGFRKKLDSVYEFFDVSSYHIGKDLIERGEYHLVLLDLNFRDQGYQYGLDTILLDAVAKADKKFPIIVCTQDTQVETLHRAKHNGADGFLFKKDYTPELWEAEIGRVLKDFHALPDSCLIPNTDGFISASDKVKALKERISKLPSFGPKMTVLFFGETGVGKEVAANYLHQVKNDPTLPFVAINLSSINENLIESELFGHVEGAFTGAIKDKIGLFEAAGNGTLFLDEIGEISLELQVKLLRVIEERKFKKVGANDSIDLEAQLVFATNVDLERAVISETFRRDFYERISTISFEIPALRTRRKDLEPLINYFLEVEEVCPKMLPMYGQTAKKSFSAAALSKLYQYHWPGNIRELRSSLQKMLFEAYVKGKDLIDEDVLLDRFRQGRFEFDQIPEEMGNYPGNASNISPKPDHNNWPIAKQTAYHELSRIEKALIDSGGRKNDAAELLGLKNDQTIRYKVKKKYFKQFPELFDSFPTIKKVYKL